jgi:predicted short-subunit dehydrogenase-like oxidoreductase (DUF2520 family)
MRIGFIGSGNLATQLAPALKKKGHQIVFIYSRSLANAKKLATKCRAQAYNKLSDIPSDLDVYIVALQDDQIGTIVSQLSFEPNCILHTSGSVSIDIFPKNISNAGVLYPLQTFTKNQSPVWKKIPIFIEGRNPRSAKIASTLANQLSESVKKVSSEKRRTIHLSAVFANNFVNHLYSLSSEILQKEKISFDILKPIILETTERIMNNDPSAIQTGPARRNDFKTMKKHLEILAKDSLKKKVYKVLSDSIINKYKGK